MQISAPSQCFIHDYVLAFNRNVITFEYRTQQSLLLYVGGLSIAHVFMNEGKFFFNVLHENLNA